MEEHGQCFNVFLTLQRQTTPWPRLSSRFGLSLSLGELCIKHSHAKQRGKEWAEFRDDLKTLAGKTYPDLADEARECFCSKSIPLAVEQPADCFCCEADETEDNR